MTSAHAGAISRTVEHSTTAVSTPTTMRTVWWLNPALLFVVVAIGTLFPAVALTESVYSSYGTPKYLNPEALGLGLLACVMVVAGVGLGMHAGAPPQRITRDVRHSLVPWFYLATGLSVFGYGVWLASAIVRGFRPSHVVALLSGGDAELFTELKFDIFQTVPGITTCTQFGLLAVLLGGILLRRDTPWLRPMVWGVMALGALRVVIYSERLALLELAVLFGLVLMRTRILDRPRSAVARGSFAMAPVVGVLLLAVMMGGTEYFRSWQYYKNEYDSLFSFTVSRLSGYYSTSHNNGAMAWNMRDGWPLPYFTLQWFWEFPLIAKSPMSYEHLVGFDPEQAHSDLLEQWGNLEFNNPGGLFMPTLDFGLIGGAAFWLGFGLVAGRLYRGFIAGSLAGMLLYPVVFLTILEMPRFLYACTVRPFPAYVLIGVILWWYSGRRGANDVG